MFDFWEDLNNHTKIIIPTPENTPNSKISQTSSDSSSLYNPSDLFKTPIPEMFHYVWLNSEFPFSLLTYTSFITCLQVTSDSGKIVLHTNSLPENSELWDDFAERAGNKLIIQYLPEVETINHFMKFLKQRHPERWDHICDIYRVLVLLRFGGVYMDIDIINLKPYTGGVLVQNFWTSHGNGHKMTENEKKWPRTHFIENDSFLTQKWPFLTPKWPLWPQDAPFSHWIQHSTP